MARKKAQVEPPKPEPVKPLTGRELLEKVKDLKGASKEEKARACGYVSQTPKRGERVNLMQFYKALIAAEGIDLDGKGKEPGQGRGGRAASYRVSVQKNGMLLIGAPYTRQMGLQPGDELTLKVGRKHIRLMTVSGDEEE
ncbi:AbrB family transcriptional regulator [Leptolyngbya sp. FACHB-261]|uniref:AbrB family transcriptional regulator n=1 Tax=Leptolyngbya sp. FACHB-261 TaxID=2692806 RepID=UPI0016885079|nr:AbrB family transcriptional regulator [Leptolyngbya sp. FACHB-261]MBD2103324.1 AbrB family transcriptional regulator [Leptolyngbya sp. FACHB-261]